MLDNPTKEKVVVAYAMDHVPPLCSHCANWMLYRYSLAGKPHEGWRCTNGVLEAGARLECPAYLREPGADDDWQASTFPAPGCLR